MIRLYLVVTADIYELPVLVTNDIEDIADFFNTSRAVIFSAISKKYVVAKRYRIVRVKIHPGKEEG
jgi:hypothetical protein